MKEIACEKVLIAKMAEADGERADLSKEDLDLHLSSCEKCRTEIARLHDIDAILQRSSRAETSVELWPTVSERLDQPITWQPFAVAVLLLLAFKLFEMVPQEDPGILIKAAPLVIFGALMLLLKENPFKINSELILEK
jgi:predicted anti-sigma-YlaC factor YlaD